jgi:hypothetical protein
MRYIGLVASLLLAACTERWERPGVTEAQADAMNAQCRAMAAATIPPHIVSRLAAPARVERERDCRRSGDREHCTFRERYVPERWEQVDLNSSQREAVRTGCMAEKGFTFRGYRPLRLE